MKLVGYQYFTNKTTGKKSLMLYCTRPVKGEGNGECFVTSGSRERPVVGLFAIPACQIDNKVIGEEVEFLYKPDDYGNPQIVKVLKV